jgi:FKBP-type peptidyl-prolyl cis-trans isomerase FkpA
MMKLNTYIFAFLILFVSHSCKTYSEQDKTEFDKKIEKHIAKIGGDYKRSESGLYYLIEEEGEGEYIKFTDEVSFTYIGKLLDGTVFDQQFERKPVTFKVQQLIEGWKEAMLYLKKGEKAKLLIPPHLGYGDYQLDAIPQHSILYFEIEVREVN